MTPAEPPPDFGNDPISRAMRDAMVRRVAGQVELLGAQETIMATQRSLRFFAKKYREIAKDYRRQNLFLSDSLRIVAKNDLDLAAELCKALMHIQQAHAVLTGITVSEHKGEA